MPKIVDHEKRREHIVGVVAEMLGTVGLEKTTIREIAHQSGYSRGLIEHYFSSKDELVSSALKWINEQSLKRMESRLEGLKGLEALRALNEVTLPVTEQARKEWKVRMQFWGLAAVNPEHAKEQAKRIHLVEKIYLEYLQQAKEIGEIPEDSNLLAMAQSLLHRGYGLSCNAILREAYFTRELQLEVLDYIMSEIVKGK